LYYHGPLFRGHWSLLMTREQAIQEITRKLIQPVRIYLFGLIARADFNEDSDLDLLVVVPYPRREAAARRDLASVPAVGFGRDIIYWRRTDFDQRAQWVKGSLPVTVVRQGKIRYDAA
jgi:hypothetical protein